MNPDTHTTPSSTSHPDAESLPDSIDGLAEIPDLATFPTLSIVVPVRNEAEFIGEMMERLLAQDYPSNRFEILIVDGMSTDDTWQIARRFVNRGFSVRLLRNEKRWSSAGRNLGVAASRGELIVVIDGHCELPDCWHFRHLASAFARSRAMILGRPQPLTIEGANSLQRAIAWRASRLGHHPDSYIYSDEDRFVPAQSVGAAYRREVFEQIGYFDERFDACEDVDFNYRADRMGLCCFLATQARVHYFPRGTLAGLFRQLARYGRGRVRLARQHPETWSWKSLMPAAFVAWGIGCVLLAFVSVGARWALLATVLSYGLVVVGVSLHVARKQGAGRAAWWLPLVYLTIHLGAGVGALQELVFGPRRMQ